MKSVFKYLKLNTLFRMKKAHDLSLEHIRGYMLSSCLLSLMNIGFFDEISEKGYINITDFSKKHDIDLQPLKSICKYLYSTGVLKRKRAKYFLSRRGIILTRDAKGPFNFISAYGPVFQNLESILKKKKRYGEDIKRIDKFVAIASAETERWIPFPVVEKLIKDERYNSILDLGCGSAEFLIRLCKQNPNIKAYGIDISEESIAYAERKIKSAGLSERIELEVCDIFKVDSLRKEMKSSDAVTSFFVIHEFLKEGRLKVINLLADLKKIFLGSDLIICELYKKSPGLLRRMPTMIAEHHLFHSLSEQKVLSIKDWEEIIKKSGYNIKKKILFRFAGQVYFVLN